MFSTTEFYLLLHINLFRKFSMVGLWLIGELMSLRTVRIQGGGLETDCSTEEIRDLLLDIRLKELRNIITVVTPHFLSKILKQVCYVTMKLTRINKYSRSHGSLFLCNLVKYSNVILQALKLSMMSRVYSWLLVTLVRQCSLLIVTFSIL